MSVHAPAGIGRLSEDLDVLVVVLALPAFLLGWRWPRVAAYTMWTLTLFRGGVCSNGAGALALAGSRCCGMGGASGLASWIAANCARADKLPGGNSSR